jgi:hypothetical protein
VSNDQGMRNNHSCSEEWGCEKVLVCFFRFHPVGFTHALAGPAPIDIDKENAVYQKMIRVSCFVGLLILGSLALGQTEFSAEVVDHNAHQQGKGPTKVYFGKDKIRFDGAGEARDGGGSVIFDLKNENWVVLMPKQHMYMEMPSAMMESRGMFHFFQTADVADACGEWLKLDANKGGTCHKVGGETVNGRSTIKYEGTNAKGEASAAWFDSKLRFPVKWDGKNGGGELQNIQEGPQPSSLFEPPAGFTKMDMGGMMKRQ